MQEVGRETAERSLQWCREGRISNIGLGWHVVEFASSAAEVTATLQTELSDTDDLGVI